MWLVFMNTLNYWDSEKFPNISDWLDSLEAARQQQQEEADLREGVCGRGALTVRDARVRTSSPREACFVSEPPFSNTGVKMTNNLKLWVTVDYLRVVRPGKMLNAATSLLECLFKFSVVERAVGVGWYNRSWQVVPGVLILSDRRDSGGDFVEETLIQVSGEPLMLLSPEEKHQLVSGLYSMGFHATRLDSALDDYSLAISPFLLREAYERGDCRGFGQKHRTRRNSTWQQTLDSIPCSTFYLGKRGSNGSGKLVRCYERSMWLTLKFKLPPGLIDPHNRVEIELTGDRASLLFEYLASSELDLWSWLLAGAISGSVDFVDGSVSDRTDRCPRLQWWNAVISDVTKIKLTPSQKKIQTYYGLFQFFKRQIVPTFALLSTITATLNPGNPLAVQELWHTWCSEGESRYSDRQLQILQEVQEEVQLLQKSS
jgi:DNA relaxase NicK